MASSTTWVLVESPQSESYIVLSQKALRREPRKDAKSCFIFNRTFYCVLILVGHSGLIFNGVGCATGEVG